jgi:hypothetical protein
VDSKHLHLRFNRAAQSSTAFSDAMDFLNFRGDPFKVRMLPGSRAVRGLNQEIDAIADRENGFCKG